MYLAKCLLHLMKLKKNDHIVAAHESAGHQAHRLERQTVALYVCTCKARKACDAFPSWCRCCRGYVIAEKGTRG